MPYTVYVGTRSGKVYKISDGSYTVVSKGDEVLQLIDGEKFSTLGVLYRYYNTEELEWYKVFDILDPADLSTLVSGFEEVLDVYSMRIAWFSGDTYGYFIDSTPYQKDRATMTRESGPDLGFIPKNVVRTNLGLAFYGGNTLKFWDGGTTLYDWTNKLPSTANIVSVFDFDWGDKICVVQSDGYLSFFDLAGNLLRAKKVVDKIDFATPLHASRRVVFGANEDTVYYYDYDSDTVISYGILLGEGVINYVASDVYNDLWILAPRGIATYFQAVVHDKDGNIQYDIVVDIGEATDANCIVVKNLA